jgi:hypothetical protein
MPVLVHRIPKDPDPDKTLAEILDDVTARNMLDRKLLRYFITATDVDLVYETPG